MVNYNLRYFVMAEEGSEKAAEVVDGLYARCGDQPDYPQKKRCLEQGVREIILERPVQYALSHLKGSARYFLDPGRFDLATYFDLKSSESTGMLQVLNQEGLSGVVRFLKAKGWGWVIALGLIGLFKLIKVTGLFIYLLRGKSELPFRIFLALLVGYLALVTGPLGASRFLLPVELLMMGAALKGWIMLLSRSGSSPYSSSIL
jgi:hypothetical protein